MPLTEDSARSSIFVDCPVSGRQGIYADLHHAVLHRWNQFKWSLFTVNQQLILRLYTFYVYIYKSVDYFQAWLDLYWNTDNRTTRMCRIGIPFLCSWKDIGCCNRKAPARVASTSAWRWPLWCDPAAKLERRGPPGFPARRRHPFRSKFRCKPNRKLPTRRNRRRSCDWCQLRRREYRGCDFCATDDSEWQGEIGGLKYSGQYVQWLHNVI